MFTHLYNQIFIHSDVIVSLEKGCGVEGGIKFTIVH